MEFPNYVPHVSYVRNAEIIQVIDGDTLEVMIDNGRKSYDIERLRLAGVDTPESRGPEKVAGLYVENRVVEWLGLPDDRSLVVDSLTFNIDSFHRIVCLVWSKQRCLNQWLLEERLAWPTDKNGRLTGSRNIDILNLPSQVKNAVREAMI